MQSPSLRTVGGTDEGSPPPVNSILQRLEVLENNISNGQRKRCRLKTSARRVHRRLLVTETPF